MPLTEEQKAAMSLARLRMGDGGVPNVIPKIPQLPDDVRKRFPSFAKWEKDMEEWRVKTNRTTTGGSD